jgi:hypothetical protein
MAAVPEGDALERSAGANERRLVEIGGHKLKCNRQTRVREPAGQGDGRMPGHVERAGISL